MQHPNSNNRSFTWFRSRPALGLGLLCALLVMAIAWLSIREIRAAQQVQMALTEFRTAGIPTDNASAESKFLEQTYREGTRDWSEVLSLLGNSWVGSQGANLPYVGSGKIPVRLDANANWQQVDEAEKYLELVQPALERLPIAAEHPKPVWQPIQFHGYATLLGPIQDAGRVVSALALSAEVALHQGDSATALRDISLIKDTAEAFDWDVFLVTKTTSLAMEGTAFRMICRSLYSDPWTPAQLDTLRELANQPSDVPATWSSILDNEQAMLLATFYDDDALEVVFGREPRFVAQLLKIPSLQAAVLSRTAAWRDIAAGGLLDMLRRSRQLQKEFDQSRFPTIDDIATGRMSWYSGAVTAIVRHEDARRLTLTAIAIKQFQLQQGRWPTRLGELESVSLTPDDWETVGCGAFGYEVDGETAYVWSYVHNLAPVPLFRPVYEQQEFDMQEIVDSQYLVEIR